MYKDSNSSSGSGASTKGDEVEIVSRFLAPLCARDETARNIALAAARTTVEGWLGGVASPNQWEDATEVENSREELTGKFKGQDGRYDMNIERSPTKSVPKPVDHQYYHRHDYQNNRHYRYDQYHHSVPNTFKMESFFPQSVNEYSPFTRNSSFDSSEKYSSGSFDYVDGRIGNEATTFGTAKETQYCYNSGDNVDKIVRSTSSDDDKAFRIVDHGVMLKENQAKFSSSHEGERKFFPCSSSEKLNDSYQEEVKYRLGKVKGARQKQLENDDLDSDTRIYGKSPKFDDNMENFGYFETNYRNIHSQNEQGMSKIEQPSSRPRQFFEFNDESSLDDDYRLRKSRDGVVFNTLDGFDNDCIIGVCDDDELINMNLESTDDSLNNTSGVNIKKHYYEQSQIDLKNRCYDTKQDYYLRNSDERKFSVGQIKRPLSQDDDVSSKSGRVIEGSEVTPGDVGRMLNLGNALDGPRQQAQANKYLSLVTLHLPVILRLSVNCPFQNVRIKCAEILQMVKERGLPVPEPAFGGPSAFVPNAESSYSVLDRMVKVDERSLGK
ncbi:hypothetical protein PV325_013893 [Microctonus aethiopoides]|nr:hypothetical protein PV325_013893 [Microctonus aethiopoides]